MILAIGVALAAYPVAADHHGRWAGDRIEWTSTYLFDAEPCEVVLVRPKPDLDLDREGCRTITVHTTQAAPFGDLTLDPPLADIAGLQRITIEEAEFVPAAELGLQPGLFREAWLSEAASPMERRKLDARIGGVPWSNRRAMYVLVDDALRKRGLAGNLRPIGFVDPGVLAAAIAAFAACMVGAVVTWRKLGRAAQSEAVDAYLEKELYRR